jgi:hypothetical protein
VRPAVGVPADPLGDTLLRLAVWLADVSAEAATATRSEDGPVMPTSASGRHVTPTKMRALVGTARR